LEFWHRPMEDLGMSDAYWNGRRVFVTGHTGFKGAWLSLWLTRLGAHVTGFSLAPPTEPNLFSLARLPERMTSLSGDIRHRTTLEEALSEAAPEIVFHLAAQSLVRASYAQPTETFDTNVMGTVNLLEACRSSKRVKAVIVVTSDKCYEESPEGKAHTEDDPLGGYDPYAASKACAEIVTGSYRRAYFSDSSGPRVASVRAGNVIGGGDWAAERLIPDLVRAFLDGRPAVIRHPHATRPWQHVLDPLNGYLILAARLATEGAAFAKAWNFGPSVIDARPVAEIVDRFVQVWGPGAGWRTDTAQQQREAPMLSIDASRARAALGWRCTLGIDDALSWTAEWYRGWAEGTSADRLCDLQIERFMRLRGPL